MSPKPLKLAEAPHWEGKTLVHQVKTILSVRETSLTRFVSGPGAKQIARPCAEGVSLVALLSSQNLFRMPL